ncbi:Pentatricopeptide repeat-containing protein [Melia azedarach]|uniref:Pentatricopeptide repeat-containing protein n=1 Tax=Melia azedarach TaxID=155640 RepID=A0ACC1Z2C5_MELAZ|nr:Pentatricopeptide repeat-containing protein [Melia azedarach]
MKLFFKRHCSSLTTLSTPQTQNPSIKAAEILRHCKSGALCDALQLLNSIDFSKAPVKKSIVYASLLQTCIKVLSFIPGLQIHAHVIKSGLDNDCLVGNSLLSLYFKLGSDFDETQKVFSGFLLKDVISWTSMISGYIKIGKPKHALELFWEMLGSDVEPNGFTLSAVIKACSELGFIRLGKCFHGLVLTRGFQSSHVISCALIDMYGWNHGPADARQLFDELLEPDAICWTSLISSFTRNDLYDKALGFFYFMHRKHGLLPDGFTFGTVLTACGNLGRLKQGKEVHAKIITSGHSGNVIVESGLVDMYGKCRVVNESQRVFDSMLIKNSVSWSALLGGYCQTGDFKSVISIFRKMEEIDLYCFGTVLRACGGLAAVRLGKEVHCQYVRRGGWKDVIIESGLVDLYAKCGCVDFAHQIFSQMPVRNLITWNSMISGFAQNGRGGEALRIFDEMNKEGTKPDHISFIGVLSACSHSGLVNQGRKCFSSMTEEYGIEPGIEHYNCMVDLLGRAGLLEEAETLIENAFCRDDSSLWAVLLGACSTFTNSVAAERIAKKMIQLEPDYYLSYVLLANVYRAVGRWNDALKIMRLMKSRGIKKMPGKSWIETNSKLDHDMDELDGLEMQNLRSKSDGLMTRSY